MPRNLIIGNVAQVLNARELVINRGANHGVKPGMRFAVLAPEGENVKDPVTRELLGSVDRIKVEVEAYIIKEKLTVARTFKYSEKNVGGTAANLSGLASLLQPPRYVKEYETLRADESKWPALSDKESLVKIGDPVREIPGDPLRVLGTVPIRRVKVAPSKKMVKIKRPAGNK